MSQVIDSNQEVNLTLKRREAEVILQAIRVRQDEHRHIIEATQPNSVTANKKVHDVYQSLDIALEQLKLKIAGQI